MTQPATERFWTDERGRVLKVDPAESAVAEQAGWRPSTPEEVAKAYERKEAGSLRGQVKTGLESVAAGGMSAALAIPSLLTAGAKATLGTEDPFEGFSGRKAVEVYEALGREATEGTDFRQAMQEQGAAQRLRAEVNPGIATTGEIAGQIGGSGGIGAVGKLAGKGGAALLGGVGKLAGRLGQAAAATGAEGGLLNLGSEQNAAYLEERKLTAEGALASAGIGALMGAGLGLAAKGGSEVFGAARRRIGAALERPVLAVGEEAGAVGKAVSRETSVEEESAVRQVLKTTDDKIEAQVSRALGQDAAPGVAENVRKAIRGENIAELAASEQGTAARELRSVVNEMETATNRLTPEWRELKADNVAKTIARDAASVAEQNAMAQDAVGQIRARIDEMMADPQAYGQRAALKNLDRHVSVAEREIASAFERGAPEETFVALDDLKRKMGPLARPGQMLSVASDAEVSREVRVLYDDLRDTLTHDAWGDAGRMQKQVNGAFEEWLGTKRLFDQRFMSETGREGWQKTFGADPAKIEPYVKGLGASRNDLTQSIIEQHVASTKSLAKALANAGELTAEKAGELKAIEQAATRFEGSVAKVQEKVGSLNQAADFMSSVRGEQGGTVGKAVLGHMMGGTAGAVAGFALDAAMNPAKFLAQRIRLEQMAERAQKAIGVSLDALFKPAAKLGEGAVQMPAAVPRAVERLKGAGAAAAHAAVPATLAAFQGKHASPEIAYRKRAEELYAATTNMGGPIREAVGRSFGGAAAHEREALATVTMAATTGINYLLSKLPAPLYDPQTLTPITSRPKPNKAEVQQFADIWTAVHKPMLVLADIPKGIVSQEQMQAIKVVYPSLFRWMQDEAWTRIRHADESGRELTLRTRGILDSMLDLNGAGEPTFAPSFGAKYGDAMGDAANRPPPPGRNMPAPGGLAKAFGTRTAEMIGG